MVEGWRALGLGFTGCLIQVLQVPILGYPTSYTSCPILSHASPEVFFQGVRLYVLQHSSPILKLLSKVSSTIFPMLLELWGSVPPQHIVGYLRPYSRALVS